MLHDVPSGGDIRHAECPLAHYSEQLLPLSAAVGPQGLHPMSPSGLLQGCCRLFRECTSRLGQWQVQPQAVAHAEGIDGVGPGQLGCSFTGSIIFPGGGALYQLPVEWTVIAQLLVEYSCVGGNLHFSAAVVQPVAVLFCRDSVGEGACPRLRVPCEGAVRCQDSEVGLQRLFQRHSLFQCLEAPVFDEEPVEAVPAGGVWVGGIVADDAGDAGEGLEVAFMCFCAVSGRAGCGLEACAAEYEN